MGDNVDAPYAEGIVDRLAQDYAELITNSAEAIRDAEDLPLIVESTIDVATLSSMVIKLRDLAGRIASHHKAEKEPFLRGGTAVDNFFLKPKEKLNGKRKELESRVDVFQQRKLAEERAKRAAEAAAARQRQLEAERASQAAEAAARRARSAETAEIRRAEAARAKVEEEMATAKADETKLATLATGGSLVRERFQGDDRSGMATMRKKKTAMVTDIAELDLEKLRFYFKPEHLEQALRAWATATDYNDQMAGAIVSKGDTTMIR
jgi:hypothetical protein